MYADRWAAGRVLAEQLMREPMPPDVLVLALPRGGVPTAYEVANRLNAALDLLLVRKLGVPGREELAMGAIALAGDSLVQVVNEEVVEALRIPSDLIDRAAERESDELRRRARAYRGQEAPPEVADRDVIVVDDGLATGATMRVAVQALRQLAAASITVAVPVAPGATIRTLSEDADRVVCPATPEPFMAVGAWYDDFEQVSDREVRDLLLRHRSSRGFSRQLYDQA